jgi:hypothetical protein
MKSASAEASVVLHLDSRCPEGLGRARSTYVRRQPEATVLHQVVREHLETFLAEARLRGGGEELPGRRRKWKTGNRKRKTGNDQ